ncbi:hypothetical protein PG994_012711 [Apiospora phragmitis]|uniref:Tubby C-terminal-like domain-containing protein n=1 Tax=Apiospora phragmitis TaxID=2905665 RepID=A0ABR1TB84_9PEZI
MGMFKAYQTPPQGETLVLKEKIVSLSGDSFDIKTLDGRPVFKVQGNAFSLSGRKEVMDVAGNHLFTIRKRLLRLHSTFYVEDPSEREIMEVAGKFSFGSSKSVATFTSEGGQRENLFMKGNFFDTRAAITDEASGQAVAVINRQLLNPRELLGGQQTYHVTVAPNVDLAVIVAMCICLDERRNEN